MVKWIVLYIAIAIETLRVSNTRACAKRVDAGESSLCRGLIPSLRKVQPCLAISFIAGEVLAHTVAGVALRGGAAPDAGGQLFTKRLVVVRLDSNEGAALVRRPLRLANPSYS